MKCITIPVLLLVIGLAKSIAMSFDELQDFSNFLKETSLLDQPLKKNPSSEDDDDVPISDHAWEESGRFEGDLILNDRQRQLIVQDIAEGLSRNGLKDSTKRWPNNEVIFYIQKEHFTSDQVQAILSGIEELGQASCVKFRPYRKGDRDAVVVQGSRRGCFSQVGYQGGYQVLNLSGRHPVGRGCFRHGTVVHEFLHTLGFYHMQSSPDRDDYIDVVWENIVQPARHNFRKYNLFSVSDFGVGYDYDSVLHYSRKAFSSNGGDTLVPKQSGAQIGQRVGLSNKDAAKLNKMYCDADSNNFEAADDVSHVPVIKKKKTPKNKPFEGHGIGYHQGKTVVFKLPAAETYQLPDTPTNDVFDYFSKTPQAMSPTLTEGFGIGKKITYSLKLPTVAEHKFPKYPALINRTMITVDTSYGKDNIENKNVQITASKKNAGDKSKETIEDFDEKSIAAEKTINTHTIHSNIYNDMYKPDTDYSEFYNPLNNYKVGTKTDYYLNYSPESKHKQDTSKEIPNLKLTKQFIENLRKPKQSHLSPKSSNKESEPIYQKEFDVKSEIADKSKAVIKEKVVSHINPYTELGKIRSIYFLNPEYMSKKYLEYKDDFSTFDNPNDRTSPTRNAKYTLFGDPVSTTESHKDGFRTLYNHNPKDRPSPTKNAKYTSFGEPVLTTEKHMPIEIINIRPEVQVPQGSTKEISKENEESATRPTDNLNFDYRHDDNKTGRDYSYEDFGDHDFIAQSIHPAPFASNEEDSAKPYEVTEIFLEQIVAVTKKPIALISESKEFDHDLEKRLPEILASYVNYDNYDITSPCIVTNFKIRC